MYELVLLAGLLEGWDPADPLTTQGIGSVYSIAGVYVHIYIERERDVYYMLYAIYYIPYTYTMHCILDTTVSTWVKKWCNFG